MVEVSDDCVIDGDNAIRTTDPRAVVRIGAGCRLGGVFLDVAGEVVVGTNVEIRGPLIIDGPGRVIIGDGCLVDRGSGGNAIHAVGQKSTVSIGRDCYLNGVDIFATDDVTLGDRCIVGECSFVTTDFHSADADRWAPSARPHAGPIIVGANVWIAARTVITKGVRIGDHSVVSIGTIVREDVPSGVIVSSHEQRIVKYLTPPASADLFESPTWWAPPNKTA